MGLLPLCFSGQALIEPKNCYMTNNTNQTTLIDELPDNDQKLRVLWYCGVKTNHSAPSEAKVTVCFQHGFLNNDICFYDVGITHIGLLQIGTVWQRKRLIDNKPSFVEKVFTVSGQDKAWEILNTWDRDEDEKPLIPQGSYALPDKKNCAPAKMVKFTIDENNNTLIIPCMEIFSRLYGRSIHVKKSLLNYPLSQAENDLIYQDVQPSVEGTWLVTVTKNCLNEDAVYLAHLKHDAVTKKRTSLIWNSLQVTHANSDNKTGFPSVPPWFSDTVNIKVKGIWLDQMKTRFLGLQILGCSDPIGPDIRLDRQNTNLSESNSNTGGTSVLIKRSTIDATEIYLTSEHEPGRSQESVQVLNPEFEIIGDPRDITRVIRDHKETGKLMVFKTDVEVTSHSGGNEFGSKLHVQRVSIDTPVIKIPPTFINVWHALNKLVNDQVLQSVSCIDIHGQPIGSDETPGLIPLPTEGINRKTQENRELYNWVMLDDNQGGQTPRRVLLNKVTSLRGECFLMEIERRISRRGESVGSESDSYKGLVVQFHPDQPVDSWFKKLLVALVQSKGVFKNALKDCDPPAQVDTFKHVSEQKQDMERAVQNGLSKIGFLCSCST